MSQDGFDGSQVDIVLTLPDHRVEKHWNSKNIGMVHVNVKDLKWISVWSRELGQDFGSITLEGGTYTHRVFNVVADHESEFSG